MSKGAPRLSSAIFGKLEDGREVTCFTLSNSSGSNIQVLNLGGVIVSVCVPDRYGAHSDIVLGLESPKDYFEKSPYFGAIVGRYVGRIANGEFTIDGHRYELAKNNGANAAHGGLIGFDKKIWDAKPFEGKDHAGLALSMVSPDGDEGYPGALSVSVSYIFDDNDTLTVTYAAETDKATVINLTQHTYFNLNGHASNDVLDHDLFVNADFYTPLNDALIPTGELSNVDNTPLDFRSVKKLGRDIDADHEQLKLAGGYDHNWVLNRLSSDGMEHAATLSSDSSGRRVDVKTNQPGLQVYTSNFLDGSIVGKSGCRYAPRSGVTLETQHFPDSPNQSNFPSTILRPGARFDRTTSFKFSTF